MWSSLGLYLFFFFFKYLLCPLVYPVGLVVGMKTRAIAHCGLDPTQCKCIARQNNAWALQGNALHRHSHGPLWVMLCEKYCGTQLLEQQNQPK